MRLAIALFAALLTTSLLGVPAAFAHTGTGSGFAMLDGIAHPLMGLDHLIAMTGVGIWAAMVGGASRWAWPAAFVAAMTLGGLTGIGGYNLPYVEAAIVISVIAVGGAVAFGARVPVVIGAGVCAAFAIAHGHAHGSDIAQGVSAAGYVAGFIISTVALQAAGIGVGGALVRSPVMARALGATMAAAGIAMAFA